ncbi:CHAT domain-containing protein [Streptomyces sp. NPDC005078]|uniref:CHAT domain-containing protein n=1 Tax=Streptomyces sp. NPDC005078 TaxID=3154293 RepID=UPI0033B60641
MQELNRLTALRRRIIQYEQGARDAVTDPTAVSDAEELLAQAPQLDLEAAAVLAWFYWYLRREVTERAHEEATGAAVRLFFRVRDLDPDAVLPPLMEQQYAARAAARELDTALAAALARDASHRRDPDAMYWAIAVLTEAETLAVEAGAHADRVVYRCLRGHQLCALYEVLGRAEDLDRAVADLSNAVLHAPDDPATAAVMHGYLGRAYLRRHQLQGRPEDLEAALAELRQAHLGLDPLGPDDPEWLVPTQNLGAALLLAGHHEEAAAVLRRLLAVHPQDSPEAAQTHHMLAGACRALYLGHHRRQDLDDCVLSLRAAYGTSLSAPGAAGMGAEVAQLLAAALLDLYRVDGEGRYLEEAARTVRECLEREDRTGARMRLLVRRSEVHYAAYHHTGDRDELDAAIGAADEILLEAAADADASRSVHWESAIGPTLAQALCERFRLEPDPNDLDLAVEMAQDGVDWSAEDGRSMAGRASQLLVLGYALTLRGEASGSPSDMDHAVEVLDEALDLLPADSPLRARTQAELGNALRARAAISGDVGDLDTSIAAYRKAAAADADHFALTGFATARLDRFLRRGGRADLDEAVTLSRGAAQAAPEHERHTALHLAGIALRLRFAHFGDLTDLDEAIETGGQAVRAIPPRHMLRPAYLSNLALAHSSHFHELAPSLDLDGSVSMSADEADMLTYDIDTSIDLLREAVDAVPVGHRFRPGLLANLADALAARFSATSRGADRRAALTSVVDALEECPTGRPERAQLLYLRARLLLKGAEALPGPAAAADRTSASEALREAADAATASPLLRMTALRQLADRAPGPAAALAVYEQAMACVPLVAWHGLGRRDRERHLTRIGPLTQEAAAAALDAGRPERAVELLEHGRAILWNQSLDTDPDLEAVCRTAPELAERLDRVRTRLRALDAGPDHSNVSADHTDLRMDLAREWDALCEQVRQHVPGCGGFLLPPDFAQLRTAATNGTVVLINVAERRSDALALSPDGLTVIPLPQLDPDVVQQRVTTYMSALESYELVDLLTALDMKRDADGQLDLLGLMMRDVLNWLWDAAAEPVLDALGHTGEPTDGAWPRVWWCPTGPLTFLPFHAAGRHYPGPRPGDRGPRPGACVLDRVVSSYTPTLRTLIKARTRPSPRPGWRRMLLVAMPETPGGQPLPDAEEDVEAVNAIFPDRTSVLAGPQATRDAVCRALGDHSWAHITCHGELDPLAPSNSGLRLHDGTLTVADLGRLSLDDAEFAFLSSCSTALTGYGQPDEAIHISAALQFAGYRHVVATMWTVLGRYAGFVADHLYNSLAIKGELASEECALALHYAVRELRAQPGMELAIWTPFIHTGP